MIRTAILLGALSLTGCDAAISLAIDAVASTAIKASQDNAAVAQLDSASPSEGEGSRFESGRPRQASLNRH